jgi:hypothetical protein
MSNDDDDVKEEEGFVRAAINKGEYRCCHPTQHPTSALVVDFLVIANRSRLENQKLVLSMVLSHQRRLFDTDSGDFRSKMELSLPISPFLDFFLLCPSDGQTEILLTS